MIGFCKKYKREVLSEADCYYHINATPNGNIEQLTWREFGEGGVCIYWTTKMIIRYKCNICGRDKFQRPNERHWCKGNYRKSKYEGFEKIVKYEGEK